MAKRRSDNPMTILVLGILSIAFFGIVLVYFSRKTPVLQLKPLVEQEFGLAKVKTRFVPVQLGLGNPSIVVELPADAPSDPAQLLKVARFSLVQYGELAKRTRVDRCTVVVRDGGPQFELTLPLLQRLEMAETALAGLPTRLADLGLQGATVRIAGLSRSGARLVVTGKARTHAGAERFAQRILKLIGKQPYAGEILVEIETPQGPLKRRGGRDVPQPRRTRRRPVRKRSPRRPAKTAKTAKTAAAKTE